MKSEFFLVVMLVSGIYSSPAPQAPSTETSNPFYTQFQNFWNGIGTFPNQVGSLVANTFRPQSNLPQIQTFQVQSPQLPQLQWPQLPQWQWPQLPQLPQLPQIFQFPFRQPNNNNQGNGPILSYFLPNLFTRPAQVAQSQFGQDSTIIIITRPASTEGQSPLASSSQSIPSSSQSSVDTTNNISISEPSPFTDASPVLIQNSSKPMNSTEFSSGIGLTIVTPNSTVIAASNTAIDPIAIENV